MEVFILNLIAVIGIHFCYKYICIFLKTTKSLEKNPYNISDIYEFFIGSQQVKINKKHLIRFHARLKIDFSNFFVIHITKDSYEIIKNQNDYDDFMKKNSTNLKNIFMAKFNVKRRIPIN